MIENNKLKEARFFAKKPQIQLWLETGIHYSTISRIECGYIKPTEEQKEKLAKAIKSKKSGCSQIILNEK